MGAGSDGWIHAGVQEVQELPDCAVQPYGAAKAINASSKRPALKRAKNKCDISSIARPPGERR